MTDSLLPSLGSTRTFSLQGIKGGVRRSPLSVRIGLVIVGFFVLVALVSLFWTPYPPLAPATGPFLASTSWSHLFGTDAVGADIFSRTMAATHTDVGITVAVIAIALVVGTLWGSLIGFYGGIIDTLSLRLLQVMNSFPALLLA